MDGIRAELLRSTALMPFTMYFQLVSKLLLQPRLPTGIRKSGTGAAQICYLPVSSTHGLHRCRYAYRLKLLQPLQKDCTERKRRADLSQRRIYGGAELEGNRVRRCTFVVAVTV